MNELSIYQNLTVDQNNVFLPEIDIPVTLYRRKIKPALEGIGGKWSTALRCFVFPFDAGARIEELRSGIKTKLISQFQYFDTPLELVGRLYHFAEENGMRYRDKLNGLFLEPGAGRGNIVKNSFVKGFRNFHYCELMPENREVLQREIKRLSIRASLQCEDFLSLSAPAKYDIVVANPPFRNEEKHIEKMFEVVKPGGFVFTIASPRLYHSPSFEKFLNKNSSAWAMDIIDKMGKDDPHWEPIFEGTDIGCTLIVATKSFKRKIPRETIIPGAPDSENVLPLPTASSGQLSLFGLNAKF